MSEQRPGFDEGYVKYASDWTLGPAPNAAIVKLLNTWRAPLWRAGLIGHDKKHNVGFGNISVRAPTAGQFIVSGTQTGHIENTSGEHYALVTEADIAANTVASTGPVYASSESLTHAAIYNLSERINAVVHVHCESLWRAHQHRLPTTHPDVTYGTPEMASEFNRLWQESNFSDCGIAVMAGHTYGLISSGVTLEQAATRVLDLRRSTPS